MRTGTAKPKKQPKGYILRPERVGELLHHDIGKMEREVGPLYNFIDPQKIKEAPAMVFIREVKVEIPARKKIGASIHNHKFDQLYCLVGNLTVDIIMNGKRKLVEGPISFFLPAGLDHAIKFVGGKGYAINILFTEKYA